VLVAVAALGQVLQGGPHAAQLLDAPVDLLDLGARQRLDVGAAAAAVLPQPEQLAHLAHGKTQAARPLDEPQRVHGILVVDPVTGIGAPDGGDQTDGLVVPDGLRRHARAFGRLPDVHRAHASLAWAWRLSQSELVATDTDDSAIAAPAIIGLNRPAAATGIATVL